MAVTQKHVLRLVPGFVGLGHVCIHCTVLFRISDFYFFSKCSKYLILWVVLEWKLNNTNSNQKSRSLQSSKWYTNMTLSQISDICHLLLSVTTSCKECKDRAWTSLTKCSSSVSTATSCLVMSVPGAIHTSVLTCYLLKMVAILKAYFISMNTPLIYHLLIDVKRLTGRVQFGHLESLNKSGFDKLLNSNIKDFWTMEIIV